MCVFAIAVVPILFILYVAHSAENFDPFAKGDFVPVTAGLTPPEDWSRLRIRGVGDVWISPAYKKTLPVYELSSEVLKRVEAFHDSLGEAAPMTLEEALESLRRHESPEEEVAVWERVGELWKSELERRSQPDSASSRLIFQALFACSLVGPDPEKLLAYGPGLAEVDDLEGLCARYPAESGEAKDQID